MAVLQNSLVTTITLPLAAAFMAIDPPHLSGSAMPDAATANLSALVTANQSAPVSNQVPSPAPVAPLPASFVWAHSCRNTRVERLWETVVVPSLDESTIVEPLWHDDVGESVA
ncbi:hypothetical protein BDZ89DRAFT_1108304 [Hymenopellis radicata]|nr:hypothetical protein BDZ89DRAFT_1162514 [Hymenopellis radicata]KAF9049380.1 hypothetical protein BDZ89DRAFT_1108304 [Hymenopellis radicata]